MIDPTPVLARTIIIAMNPHSGAGDRGALINRLQMSLESSGFEVQRLTDLEQVRVQAVKHLHAGDLRVVIAAGGDGTISRLVNELPPQTPLAVFPMGTENLLAKYLEQSSDPQSFAEMIIQGQLVSLDSGVANGKRFLIMASCGFDADVVERLHAQRKGHIRHWSYAKPIFDSINNYPYPPLQIWIDDEPEPIEARWAFVFNVPRYAMNLPIVTDADPTDGQLELCSFREGNLLRGLYYLFSVVTGRHRFSKESYHCKFRRLRIQAKDAQHSAPYQLDGDPGGKLPLVIEVQPNCFRVVVTSAWIDKTMGRAMPC